MMFVNKEFYLFLMFRSLEINIGCLSLKFVEKNRKIINLKL